MDNNDWEDESYRDDPLKNEARYALVWNSSRFHVWAMLREAWREDHELRLPRFLAWTFGTFVYIPFALLRPRGPARMAYVDRMLRTWGRMLCRIADVRLDVRGSGRLDPARTYLFALNHSSPIDVTFAYATTPNPSSIVANIEFDDIPVVNFWLRNSDTVMVKREDPEGEFAAFKKMTRLLHEGRSVVIWPEGYIHRGKGIAEFKRGGVQAAVLAGVPVVPVCVYGSARVMVAGSLHLESGKTVHVEFGEPIETRQLTRDGRRGLEETVRQRILEMKQALARLPD